MKHPFNARCSVLLMSFLFGFVLFLSPMNAHAEEQVSVIKRAAPVYPKYAVKRNIEGAVLVHFSIEKDGGVSDIEVVESDQDGLFDASAILGVQKWLYTKSSQKIRNNYVAIEFVQSDNPKITTFSNVEAIQIRPK